MTTTSISVNPAPAHHEVPETLPPNNSNNKSIDSMILNSPSSLHRLQTLTRRQRTPLSNRSSCDPSTRMDSIDLTSPDTLSTGGIGVLSSASSVLYLSDVCSSNGPGSPEQALKPKSFDHRSSTPFGSSSTSTGHSIAYYLQMPRLDRFLSLTHHTFRLAFIVLPLIWIIIAVSWIVVLRKRNTLMREQLEAMDGVNEGEDTTDTRESIDPKVPEVQLDLELGIEETIATWCTITGIIVSLLFLVIFVIKSNWAYSFEFVPTEDDFEEFETTMSSVSNVPEVKLEEEEKEPEVPKEAQLETVVENAAEITVNVISDSEIKVVEVV